MMMEAIRLSLAAEEERKKREEKEAAKNAKKEEKQKAKEAKKAEKAAKRGNGSVGSLYSPGLNSSSASQFTTGEPPTTPSGKGKAPDRSGIAGGFNPLTEPTSTINSENSCTVSKEDSQRHLEQSRVNIQTPSTTGDSSLLSVMREQPNHRHALRQLSNASSSASSFMDSSGENAGGSSCEASPNASGLQLNSAADVTLNAETPGTEPMFNFRSLAAVIGDEDKENSGNLVEHVEHASAQHSPLATPEASTSAAATSESATSKCPSNFEDNVSCNISFGGFW